MTPNRLAYRNLFAETSWLLLLVFLCLTGRSYGQTYGVFTYSVSGTNVAITKFNGIGGEVIIPSEIPGVGIVTTLKNSAFYGSFSSIRITIPNSVTNIESGAFAYCNGLSAITVDAQNLFYSSLRGVLFNKSQSILIHCPSKMSGAYTIPSSVTFIEASAFANCNDLASVTIPSNVTSIGYGAFANCSGLTAITVDPQNLFYSSLSGVLFNKNQSVLVQCPGKMSGAYIIPSSVTSIGNAAFALCRNLTSITTPDSVISIGDSAFLACASLTNIIIPNSVSAIGDLVFQYCTGLTSITLPTGVTSIGDSVFEYCSGLTNITLPSSLTSIGYRAFNECTGLTSITLPDSVTSIGDAAFYYCLGLTNIILPSKITTIGDSAFFYCSDLTTISLPASVTSIGNYAFLACASLTNITIPSSVNTIGNLAFANCGNLAQITLPNSVSAIGDEAFTYSGLTSFTFPTGVTTTGNKVFAYCKDLTNVTLPGSLTSIGDSLFYNCSGLTNISLPTSVTAIENYAFLGCVSLTNITIPSSVTTIGDSAFAYCSGLTNAYFQGDAPLSFGSDVFAYAGNNFSIYYPATASGWTTPTWNGYLAYPYTYNPPVPPPVASLALSSGIATPSFSNLQVGTNYQLRASADLNTWTNSGAPFTATNTSQTCPQSFDVNNGSQLFFRLQSVP